MEPIVRIKNMSKSFGSKEIFSNFSCEIMPQTMVAIVGKSGSGKTTLLNIIVRIEMQTSGDVSVFGLHNVRQNSHKANCLLRYRIAMLLQDYGLIDNLNVEENIRFALHYAEDKSQQVIDDALAHVGLPYFNKQKIYALSGGEQQRVALARCLVKPSMLILADEPTVNVDEENKFKIIDILVQLKNAGKTVIVVTHDESLLSYFDKVIRLS